MFIQEMIFLKLRSESYGVTFPSCSIRNHTLAARHDVEVRRELQRVISFFFSIFIIRAELASPISILDGRSHEPGYLCSAQTIILSLFIQRHVTIIRTEHLDNIAYESFNVFPPICMTLIAKDEPI